MIMKNILPLAACSVALFFFFATSAHAQTSSAASLADLARSHEQVFKELADEQTALVLQRGDKQFVIYGVTHVRAVGSAIEVTVKNGRKYSVNPADVFFLTNDAFGLK